MRRLGVVCLTGILYENEVRVAAAGPFWACSNCPGRGAAVRAAPVPWRGKGAAVAHFAFGRRPLRWGWWVALVALRRACRPVPPSTLACPLPTRRKVGTPLCVHWKGLFCAFWWRGVAWQRRLGKGVWSRECAQGARAACVAWEGGGGQTSKRTCEVWQAFAPRLGPQWWVVCSRTSPHCPCRAGRDWKARGVSWQTLFGPMSVRMGRRSDAVPAPPRSTRARLGGGWRACASRRPHFFRRKIQV